MHVCVEEGEPSLATPAVHPGEGHREAPDSRAGPPGCQQGAPADRQAGAGSDRCVPIFQVRSVLQPGGLLPLQHVQPALLPGWGGELGGGGLRYAQVCSGGRVCRPPGRCCRPSWRRAMAAAWPWWPTPPSAAWSRLWPTPSRSFRTCGGGRRIQVGALAPPPPLRVASPRMRRRC